ncbi:MAG: dihydrodipicolinate synthase family protein [Caldilinea sp. CFX5]|nr:dihydrodipicolinate synthase family protein [Caldilinea sp. CFX5]
MNQKVREKLVDWDEIRASLRGPAALVMAPFRQDLSLDLPALERNIRYILDGGLRTGQGFLVVPCGVGEYVTLTPEEHRQMVETAVRVSDGQAVVVAGVASCRYQEAISLAANARRAGAVCVMAPPPYYYRLDPFVFYDWYRLLAESVDVGWMIYDQVHRGDLGANLTLSGIAQLAALPNLIALKYGGPLQHSDMIPALQRFGQRFAIINNAPGFTCTIAHMYGAAGYVSGPVTWWPHFELRYWALLEAQRYHEADQWQARLHPYLRYFSAAAPAGEPAYFVAALIKATLDYVGLTGGYIRPPFRPLTAKQRDELYNVLDQIGVKEQQK